MFTPYLCDNSIYQKAAPRNPDYGEPYFAIGWVFYFTIQVSPAMIMSRREPKPFDDEI